jgi:hypothetical protein
VLEEEGEVGLEYFSKVGRNSEGITGRRRRKKEIEREVGNRQGNRRRWRLTSTTFL